MIRTKIGLLAAGVSTIALGFATPANAQSTPPNSGPDAAPAQNGMFQGTVSLGNALNTYTILGVDEIVFGEQVIVTTPISQGIDLTTLGFPQAIQNAAATQNLEFPDITFGGNTNG